MINMKKMKMSDSFATVYYAAIPEREPVRDVFPKEREDEIFLCRSDKARIEKYYVWKLLEYAVKDAFNLEIDNLQFTKTPCGKWICPDVFFSLAHTDGLVCVAVSESTIGVDAEMIKPMRAGIEAKILTERELCEFTALAESERDIYLLERWCKKEAIFKMRGGEALMPRSIEVEEYSVFTDRVNLGEREYLLAVCAESAIFLKPKYDFH